MASAIFSRDGVLYVVGTPRNDDVTIDFQSADRRYRVHTNFTRPADTYIPMDSIVEIVFLGLSGDDHVKIGGSVKANTFLDGGDGNDTLEGGKFNVVLVGGATNFDGNYDLLRQARLIASDATPYGDRVTRIVTLFGTLHDDLAVDDVKGSEDRDMFFANKTAPSTIKDKLGDFKADTETLIDVGL